MADRMTKEQRHKCMASIRSKNTSPELAVRRGLHKRGFRFRIHVKSLPGTPDIVLARWKTIILVNGCFWHGHENCSKYVTPRSNKEFWETKIARNRHRDEVTTAHLTALDWHVLTIWECETCGRDRLETLLDRITDQIRIVFPKMQEESRRRNQSKASAKREQEEIMKRQAALEAEIDALYPIPKRIRRMSKEEGEF